MQKAIATIFITLGLIVGFQNCSAKTNFSDDKNLSSSAVNATSGTIANPPQVIPVSTPLPIAAPTPNPATAALKCLSYVLNGDGATAGSYTFLTVPAGTKIYQKVACFSRPMNIGYQASYCSGQLVGGCNDCLGAAGEYVCGANGYWAPITN